VGAYSHGLESGSQEVGCAYFVAQDFSALHQDFQEDEFVEKALAAEPEKVGMIDCCCIALGVGNQGYGSDSVCQGRWMMVKDRERQLRVRQV
jgi:hypothetical protein